MRANRRHLAIVSLAENTVFNSDGFQVGWRQLTPLAAKGLRTYKIGLNIFKLL